MWTCVVQGSTVLELQPKKLKRDPGVLITRYRG